MKSKLANFEHDIDDLQIFKPNCPEHLQQAEDKIHFANMTPMPDGSQWTLSGSSKKWLRDKKEEDPDQIVKSPPFSIALPKVYG